ncbi:hypothetical protein ACQR3W_21720 [Rhodococcus ruber]|uniref:Uncharacterized protein n=1 Tax=Rhodococcus ruber TaxID=1830 RepID=A0A098BJP7_9NOCA|nr:hypothetical protein [Rhodococcus ruber]MCZ4533366.1 hypothetical protein [Rhodococcus ruber]MCZ4533383.1 hypothetical protein [Rhodococcus ruber]CDZ88974.1 hypothetical protein RHRU231_450141 [Rhodococcus ruber]
MKDFHARMRSATAKPRPGTSLVEMKVRDSVQDYRHALSEAEHLMRFGVPREQAFERVGLTVEQVVKRESRERAS